MQQNSKISPPSSGQASARSGGMMACWPAGMTCVNHPDSPGRQRDVHPAGICRNFGARCAPPLRLEPPEPPNDEVRFIGLTQGQFDIVDVADYAWLSRHKWHATRSAGGYYAARSQGRRTLKMHRVIMEPPPGMVVDHIDGNGLNNRRCNLRICTHAEHGRNLRSRRGTSQYKGVYYCTAYRRWIAHICINGKNTHIGSFATEIEAARAYDRKAREVHGRFAHLTIANPIETVLDTFAGLDPSVSISIDDRVEEEE